jgi:hypothetical protein
MKHIYLVNYRVKGIKTLEEEVSLSFYKKTITMPLDTKEYNIKGIYGINGSGKSGIVASVDILRNLLLDDGYLNNPMVQKNLDAIINKKSKELFIGADFLAEYKEKTYLYRYGILLKKTVTDKFAISSEKLSYRLATSKKDDFNSLIEVKNGIIDYIDIKNDEELKNTFIQSTLNLLSMSAVSSVFLDKMYPYEEQINNIISLDGVLLLINLGIRMKVYMDQSDNHIDYLLKNMLMYTMETDKDDTYIDSLRKGALRLNRSSIDAISGGTDLIAKPIYTLYEKKVKRLKEFIKIFKPDLTDISIDRKEDGDNYVCNLNMVYGDYVVHTEFESTGVKKLIRLFDFLQNMVQGGIVFIDEFDSNLHDVYLCALLEYLMEYGKGQLCFTTHNVGPMDVLKRNKKSIDFLSIDHKIYPWTTNGNYSPSKLYRNGMIEGSPFNVDSIDFIGIFDPLEEVD